MDLLPENRSESQKLNFSRIATLLVTAVSFVISISVRSILEVSWIASDVITTGVFIPLVLVSFGKEEIQRELWLQWRWDFCFRFTT